MKLRGNYDKILSGRQSDYNAGREDRIEETNVPPEVQEKFIDALYHCTMIDTKAFDNPDKAFWDMREKREKTITFLMKDGLQTELLLFETGYVSYSGLTYNINAKISDEDMEDFLAFFNVLPEQEQ